MMTRRIIRTITQLGTLLTLITILVFFIDKRYRVLPTAIHNHLPAHQHGQVITDITVHTCTNLNPLSSCRLQPLEWDRIEKDLYLGTGWFSSAYVHVKRRLEQELTSGDSVVMDVKVGRLNPAQLEVNGKQEDWEARPGGLWLRRSSHRQAADSHHAVTAVEILYGADAADPRPGWEVKDNALLVDSAEGLEPRMTIRLGMPRHIDRPKPRIRKDGKFKILQAADLHLSTGLGKCRDVPEDGGVCDDADPRTLDFLGRMLDSEKPDFVVLSGDQVNGETAPDVQTAILKFADYLIKRRVPYAAIFGNHDGEGNMSRAEQMALMEQLPYSMSQAGPSDIDGVGNYYIEILAPGKSDHSALTLYFLDSHSYSSNERKFPGYDWIKENQIEWFRETASSLQDPHKHYTHIHMSMAFIHIPLPQYRDANDTDLVGQRLEYVTAPVFDSGFKDALVEQNVLALSCGHDHCNEYCAVGRNEQSEVDMWMCFGGGMGFGGYAGYNNYHRRLRIFDIDANSARIKTWKRLEWGDTEARLDEQLIADGGRPAPAPVHEEPEEAEKNGG